MNIGISLICARIYIYNINIMDLEQQKIILTKQLEDIQKRIGYYWLDKIAHDAWPFKDLITKRDSIKYQIEELKKEIEKQTLSI